MPLISVVIPTHKRPEMLAEALASVRAQTFTDYEIIVVSNGESAEDRAYSCSIAMSSNARYFALDEGNLPAARNFGAGRAIGEWIAFLDDDDVWLPQKLARQITEAQRTGADMISCDFIQFSADGREAYAKPRLPEGWTYTKAANHLRWWWAQPSCVLVKRCALDQVGGFDERQRMFEDTELWRRISWRHAIHQMTEPLMRYRSGHGSMMRNTARMLRYEMRFIIKTYFDTPRDLRFTLPGPSFIIKRFLHLKAPQWLRQPRKSWEALKIGRQM